MATLAERKRAEYRAFLLAQVQSMTDMSILLEEAGNLIIERGWTELASELVSELVTMAGEDTNPPTNISA